MKQVRIQSDGDGFNTTVTLDDGTEIKAYGATIWLESRELNRAEVTFLGPSLDVHAELAETTMKCPICSNQQTHYCPESRTL